MSRTFAVVLVLLLLANVAAGVTAAVGFRPGALWHHVPPTWFIRLIEIGLPAGCLALLVAGVIASRRRAYPAAAAEFLVMAAILAEYFYFVWAAAHA